MTLNFRQSCLLLAGVAIIMLGGIFLWDMPISILLLLEAVFTGIVAIAKKIPYEQLQKTIFDSISAIISPILILLLIGGLVASWIMCGTVPTLIYIGLKAIDPSIFLIVTFLMCSLTSMLIGTSWGTISTLGIAFMGISNGLGAAPIYTVSAIVSGAILGDKMSPLSSSVVLACQLTGCGPIDNMKALARTNGSCFLLSLLIYGYIGFFTKSAGSGSADTSGLLSALTGEFTISILTLLPPALLIVLILLKVPTIPTFVAGVLAGAAEALLIQGYPVEDVAQGLLSGYDFADDPVVNQLLNYGGMDGMASILTMLMFAAAFGGIIKKLGVIDCLLGKIFGDSGNVFRIITSSAIVHAVCFVVTGNYYAINSILAPSLNEIYDRHGLPRENVSAILLDTGTGISPLVPWSATSIFVSGTLGYASLDYCLFAPILWLAVVIYPAVGFIQWKKKRRLSAFSDRAGHKE